MNTTAQTQDNGLAYQVYETMKNLQEPEINNEVWDFLQFKIQQSVKKEKKIQALRNAIEDGENSGIAEDFDFDVFLSDLKISPNAKL
jgi:hypothetical protein